jgi:hypothetical protein
MIITLYIFRIQIWSTQNKTDNDGMSDAEVQEICCVHSYQLGKQDRANLFMMIDYAT